MPFQCGNLISIPNSDRHPEPILTPSSMQRRHISHQPISSIDRHCMNLLIQPRTVNSIMLHLIHTSKWTNHLMTHQIPHSLTVHRPTKMSTLATERIMQIKAPTALLAMAQTTTDEVTSTAFNGLPVAEVGAKVQDLYTPMSLTPLLLARHQSTTKAPREHSRTITIVPSLHWRVVMVKLILTPCRPLAANRSPRPQRTKVENSALHLRRSLPPLLHRKRSPIWLNECNPGNLHPALLKQRRTHLATV